MISGLQISINQRYMHNAIYQNWAFAYNRSTMFLKSAKFQIMYNFFLNPYNVFDITTFNRTKCVLSAVIRKVLFCSCISPSIVDRADRRQCSIQHVTFFFFLTRISCFSVRHGLYVLFFACLVVFIIFELCVFCVMKRNF